jgi:hypothetical protein
MARSHITLAILTICVFADQAPAQVSKKIEPILAGPKRKIDLTPEFQRFGLTALQQGDRGDCSLFALTALVEFELAKNSQTPLPRLSEEYLIWAAHAGTRQPGDQAMFYEAVHGLNSLGICTEALMPYEIKRDPGHSPSPKARVNAKERSERWQAHWIKRWDVKRQLTKAELNMIKEALAAGHPVACGLRWPKKLDSAEIIQVPPPGQVDDGHSIAFVGYEDDPTKPGGGVFFFRNSFGPQWGDKGYGVMSFGYVLAYANDALWLQLEPPNAEVPLVRFEAEALPVVLREKCETSVQDMRDWGKTLWSQGKQLFGNAKKGGFAALGFHVEKPGTYRVRVLATAAPDYGKIEIALDGKAMPGEFDLYSGRVCPAGSLELGTHFLAAGEHRIRFTSVGKDGASGGFSFGIDAVDLLGDTKAR